MALKCKTGLKKDVIKEDVFKREIALCKKLSRENGEKCGLGICKKCGVLPLLVKLHKGILLEKEELKKMKDKILKINK